MNPLNAIFITSDQVFNPSKYALQTACSGSSVTQTKPNDPLRLILTIW